MHNPLNNGLLRETRRGKNILTNNFNESFDVDDLVAALWTMIDGSKSITEIARDLTKNTCAKPETIEKDLLKIISRMKNSGLAS